MTDTDTTTLATETTEDASVPAEVVSPETTTEPIATESPLESTASAEAAKDGANSLRGRRGPGGREGGRGRTRERAPRERSEFDQVTLDVRRVARVMAGGRRFSFSVTVVIGDKKGRVGVGIGKGADTALAIEKATRSARKNLITIARTNDNSIPHELSYTYGSSIITLMPSPGRGLVAGSAMRTVLEYAGVTNVIGKILSRSKNKLTIARATAEALKSLNQSNAR